MIYYMCMRVVYNFYKHDYKNALVFNLNDGLVYIEKLNQKFTIIFKIIKKNQQTIIQKKNIFTQYQCLMKSILNFSLNVYVSIFYVFFFIYILKTIFCWIRIARIFNIKLLLNRYLYKNQKSKKIFEHNFFFL